MSISRVSVVLLQNLNSSLFSFWNRSLNHNYFFNLALGKVLVVQQYPEIWTFQETWKHTLHQPDHCLISHRQDNVSLLWLAFSMTAIRVVWLWWMIVTGRLHSCHILPFASLPEKGASEKSQPHAAPVLHSLSLHSQQLWYKTTFSLKLFLYFFFLPKSHHWRTLFFSTLFFKQKNICKKKRP